VAAVDDVVMALGLTADHLLDGGFEEREKAREWLARALAVDDAVSDSWYNIACTYALLGDPDMALDLLERWLPRTGPDQRRWLAEDRDFESIRKNPRYAKLMDQYQPT
jgi:adenylate cyclase